MKFDCGCKIRRILKDEREDYPEGTEWVVDEVCDKHNDISQPTSNEGA